MNVFLMNAETVGTGSKVSFISLILEQEELHTESLRVKCFFFLIWL